MKAIRKTAAVGGPEGTELADCEIPSPGIGEVLIRVGAAAICGTDKHIYHWDESVQNAIDIPRTYGHEFCGFVETIGEGVGADLFPGDYVSAEMHVVCGVCPPCRTGNGHICTRTKILGLHGDGAFAEFVVVPASNVIKLDSRYVPIEVGAFLDALGNAVHSTQVVDLAGKSVAITGFGPIGAMAAAIAEHSGAALIVVTDVADHALESARRWAANRNITNLHAFNVSRTNADDIRAAVQALTAGNGVDVLLEMSGAPAAINLGLDIVGMGGFVSLLGLPAGKSLTIDNYTRNVIFKGLTVQGIIGRRMYSTWQRMLALLRSGLDVAWVVQAEHDLADFHDAIGAFDRHEALKVVLYPEGKDAAVRRLQVGSIAHPLESD